MIKCIKTLFKILCLCLFWLSCEENNNNLENYTYPIALGNTWIYHGGGTDTPSGFCSNDNFLNEQSCEGAGWDWVSDLENEDGLISQNNCILIDTITVDSVFNETDNVYRFKIKESTDCDNNLDIPEEGEEGIIPANREYFEYYSNQIDGLYRHYFDEEGNLSEIRLVIKYPIQLNEQWSYTGDPLNFTRLVSEVTNSEFTIKTLWGEKTEDEFSYNQTYSNLGLISLNLFHLLVESTEMGETGATFEFSINKNLVEYELY